MGTLVGHVAPGVGFIVVGLWHLYSHIRLFLLRPGSYVAPVWFPVRGARHLELILVISGAVASILMELVVGPARHQPFDDDGTVPSDPGPALGGFELCGRTEPSTLRGLTPDT